MYKRCGWYRMQVMAFVSSAVLIVGSSLHALETKAFWDAERQTMDGFGGAIVWPRVYLPKVDTTMILEIMEKLFSDSVGAGLTIVRNEVSNSYRSSDTSQWDWAQGGWQTDEIWMLRQVSKYPGVRINSCPWTPPAYMKSNGTFNNGGTLLPAKYQAYAEYLADYIQGYATRYGIRVDILSVQNEPGFTTAYQSCTWSGEALRDFVKNNLVPTFSARGITTKLMATDDAHWGESRANAVFDDAAAASKIDYYSAHGYFGMPRYDKPIKMDKHSWQTEESMLSRIDTKIPMGLLYAKHIHKSIVTARTNAWLFWVLIDPRTNTNEGLVFVDTLKDTYLVSSALWTMGNYSRFVKPGWVRIQSMERDSTGVYTTVYKNPANNQMAVVVINDTTLAQPYTFTLDKGTMSSLSVYRTSDTEKLAKLTNQSAQGATFAATLAAKSVTTFIGTVSQSAPAVKPSANRSITIEAENFAKSEGLTRHNWASVTGWNKGKYVRYDNVDLGQGVSTFWIRMSCPDQDLGKEMTVRLDSLKAPAIATIKLMTTNAVDNLEWQGVSIAPIAGKRSLFITTEDTVSGRLDCFGFGVAGTVQTANRTFTRGATWNPRLQALGSRVLRLQLPENFADQEATLFLNDLAGRQIASVPCRHNRIVQLRRPSRGTYQIRIQSKTGSLHSKILIP